MSLTRTAARSVAPLLGRLVLAAAFIPLGWEKIMGEEQVYQGRDAEILWQIGVGGSQEGPAAAAGIAVEGVLARAVQPLQQRPDPPLTGTLGSRGPKPATQPDPGADPDPDREDDPAVSGATVKGAPAATTITPAPAPAPVDDPDESGRGPGGTVRAKAIYRDAITMTNAGLGPPAMPPWLPLWGARVIAFVQLFGAGLLLVGIFSRVWAAGLAVVIVTGFYTTSASIVSGYALTAPMPADQFNAMFSALGLFVFSLCLAFTGAGGLSLDGMLFQSADFDGDDALI